MKTPVIVAHADWSTSPKKRWITTARLRTGGYGVLPPRPVVEATQLIAAARASSDTSGPVLIGFDFPIGLPSAYGSKTGFSSFVEALKAFGHGAWSDWFEVAEHRGEVSLQRPFYPTRPGGRRQSDLLSGLGVPGTDQLLRVCERATVNRRAACPLFWTLGGNQVGKAAITGWREVITPALNQPGTALWPFDGSLAELLEHRTVILAETYPADACTQIGVKFQRGMSKRRRQDRRAFAGDLFRWALDRRVALDPRLALMIQDGFGDEPEGEDKFDSLVGLLGMLDVAMERRSEGTPHLSAVKRWEGWIMGQVHGPVALAA